MLSIITQLTVSFRENGYWREECTWKSTQELMLEEILLFHSTHSKRLLPAATLIGRTDSVRPCRDGGIQLRSSQDSCHWSSRTLSEHALSPLTLSKGFYFGPRSLLLMGWCPAGGRLWKVPVQEQAHLCKMALGSISRQGDKEHPAKPSMCRTHPTAGRGLGDGCATRAKGLSRVRDPQEQDGGCCYEDLAPDEKAPQKKGEVGPCHGAPFTHPTTSWLGLREEELSLCIYFIHKTYQRNSYDIF